MITINYCSTCGAQFLIPMEYSDGLDATFFVCPECFSKRWEKLSDSPIKHPNNEKNDFRHFK